MPWWYSANRAGKIFLRARSPDAPTTHTLSADLCQSCSSSPYACKPNEDCQYNMLGTEYSTVKALYQQLGLCKLIFILGFPNAAERKEGSLQSGFLVWKGSDMPPRTWKGKLHKQTKSKFTVQCAVHCVC